MADDRENQIPAQSEIEREILQSRKFTPEEAMARMAGPGAMKGASPVSPVRQAETHVGNWLNDNLVDASGALKVVLQRNLKGSELLLQNLEQPLRALASFCQTVLASDNLLKEIVREADIEWGRAMDERPFFEREGAAPNPEDPYTVEDVREALAGAIGLLSGRDA